MHHVVEAMGEYPKFARAAPWQRFDVCFVASGRNGTRRSGNRDNRRRHIARQYPGDNGGDDDPDRRNHDCSVANVARPGFEFGHRLAHHHAPSDARDDGVSRDHIHVHGR